jgi:hypothetical protein
MVKSEIELTISQWIICRREIQRFIFASLFYGTILNAFRRFVLYKKKSLYGVAVRTSFTVCHVFQETANHRWRTNMTVAFFYYVQKYKKFDLIII